jgi:hypothetical protein
VSTSKAGGEPSSGFGAGVAVGEGVAVGVGVVDGGEAVVAVAVGDGTGVTVEGVIAR